MRQQRVTVRRRGGIGPASLFGLPGTCIIVVVDHDYRAGQICDLLRNEYPDTTPLLTYRNAYELLTAVILSAQTTDAQVNRVTPQLFEKFPTPSELSRADPREVERIVRPTGFYRMKAKNITACAARLVRDHGGQVPKTMDELTSLPGVGRKTAGVILAAVYGQPAIIVDTHFGRVAGRLGLTDQEAPRKIEDQIAKRVRRARWSELSMLLNRHGRRFCTSRAPKCGECPIVELCPFPTVSRSDGGRKASFSRAARGGPK